MPPKRKNTESQPTSSSKRAKTEGDPTVEFPYNLEWNEHGREIKPGIPELIYLDGSDAKPSSKVAGFDIDCTIIRTKSGRKFPIDHNDWKFFDAKVPKKLKELHENDTKVVFFTNQGGIEKGNTDITTLEKKFEAIISAIAIPIQVFISTGSSHYRKPSPEMWKFMESNCNRGTKVDLSESLYVGDAAGRPKDWIKGKPKDFSSSDRMFAANVGVRFATPESYFLGIKDEGKYEWRSLDVKELMKSLEGKEPPETLHSETQEIVVFVGRPASGKSTLTKRYFTPHGYVSVNRDTLGTKEKCLKIAKEALEKTKSVVVDNTNPKKVDRKVYIDLAKQYKIPIRCVYIDIDQGLSFHLNMFRQNQSKGIERRVPEVAYRTYEKYFEVPEVSEGFDEVVLMDFVPLFKSESEKELFEQWTCM